MDLVMRKIGILYHPMKEAAQPLAEKLERFLDTRGIPAWICSAWEVEAAKAQVNGTDLILSIGGDGTILRAAQTIVPEPIPITGINLGHLGFMTELSVDEAEDKLAALLDGNGWIDERCLLQAELSFENKKNKQPQKFYALNDDLSPLQRGLLQCVRSCPSEMDIPAEDRRGLSALDTASRIATAPSSGAGRLDREPRNAPVAVRAPLTMTTSLGSAIFLVLLRRHLPAL